MHILRGTYDDPPGNPTALPQGEFDESKLYGPYNGLLNVILLKREDFMVVPQCKYSEYSKAVDFTIVFIVRHNEPPVFFLRD